MAIDNSARVRRLDITPDFAAAKGYAREVKIACDDLYANPFDHDARAVLLKLIVDASPEADAAFARALARNGAGTMGD
jgi:hypothetical protein